MTRGTPIRCAGCRAVLARKRGASLTKRPNVPRIVKETANDRVEWLQCPVCGRVRVWSGRPPEPDAHDAEAA